MWLNPPPVDGGAKITRQFVCLRQSQIALKLDTALIQFTPGFYRRFMNAPVSMDFKHTLSAQSPNIAENYHIDSYRSSTNKDTTCEIVAGIRQRRFIFVVDDSALRNSKLDSAEVYRLILNNRIADIIRENKKILYAELMQWAKNNLQS
jgi:hypothetical protein